MALHERYDILNDLHTIGVTVGNCCLGYSWYTSRTVLGIVYHNNLVFADCHLFV
jgi:hypothetical protein